jgi:hypothetical protein
MGNTTRGWVAASASGAAADCGGLHEIVLKRDIIR